MKKLKLYCIGNSEKFNHYEFDKTTEVMKALSDILERFFDVFICFHEDKKINIKEGYSGKINFEKYVDRHVVHRGKGVRADFFYGQNKLFLTILCSQKARTKFNEELMKFFSMPGPKSIKSYE